MCLVTKNPQPKVAKEPIRVYKVMLKHVGETIKIEGEYDFYFPCQRGGANIGDTVKATSNKKPDFCPSFNTTTAEEGIVYLIEGQGVHAYSTLEDARNSHLVYEVITEWEIPAGAKYWRNLRKNEIAATEMKFLRVVETTEK